MSRIQPVTALAQIQAAEEGTDAISISLWRRQQTRMSARGFDIMSLSELKPGRSDSIVCKGLDSVGSSIRSSAMCSFHSVSGNPEPKVQAR